jgi:predicted TIM-barrel fold metal-dependent hydrolase
VIVDVHTHIWKCPGHVSDEFCREANMLRSDPVDLNVDPDDHYAAMAKVDRAIVFGFQAPHVGLDVPNDFIADYVKRDPEKLIGFLSVDPMRGDPVAEIDRCVQDLGLRGVKLGPIYQGFPPDHPRAHLVYKRSEELGLPILIHQATTFPRKAPLKYGQPMLLEDIALAYPDLVIVLAHCGHPWAAETMVLIRKQPNLYTDVSGLFYRPWQLYNTLLLAMDYGVTHKLLFGTDYPVAGVDETIEGLYKITEIGEGANLPRVPREVIDGIIHRDSLALMGLS